MILKKRNNKCWCLCGEKEIQYTAVNRWCILFGKFYGLFLKKMPCLNNTSPCCLSKGYKNINLKGYFYSYAHHASLFTIVKIWNWSNCLSTDYGIRNTVVKTHGIQRSYLKDKIMPFGKKIMELDVIIWNKIIQEVKKNLVNYSYICRI